MTKLINPLMCDNLEKARQNRERVASGQGNPYYDWQDQALRQIPFGQSLPDWVPTGELPTIYHSIGCGVGYIFSDRAYKRIITINRWSVDD